MISFDRHNNRQHGSNCKTLAKVSMTDKMTIELSGTCGGLRSYLRIVPSFDSAGKFRILVNDNLPVHTAAPLPLLRSYYSVLFTHKTAKASRDLERATLCSQLARYEHLS